jgi:hypothetical protein
MQGLWRPGYWPEQGYDAALEERCRVAALNARPFVARAPVAAVPVAPVVVKVSALDTAVAFLRDALTPDPVGATQVAEMAKERSIAARTLRRGFQKTGVQTFKKSGQWWWKLPDEDGQSKGGRIPRAPRRRSARTTGAETGA